MIKVSFENVGRDKQSWTEEFCELSESVMYHAIKKRRALASKDIYFDRDSGQIYAGVREVGTFKVFCLDPGLL